MSASPQYRLFGISVRSDLPLPGLECDEPEEDGVRVRFGSLPSTEQRLAVVGGGHLQVSMAGVGRFRISNGREIVVDPDSGANDRDVRAVLLGTAFGALLHQRGILPLHANAVEVDGIAVAFAGRSGTGKSTLANWFSDQGQRVLSDDVCAVYFGPNGPLVMPGLPRLRLRRDALETSGRHTSDHDLSFEGQDKYDVPVLRSRGPLPLGACYILDEPGNGEFSITSLAGAAAVQALVAHTYRGSIVPMVGGSLQHWRNCLRTAKQAAVRSVVRNWGDKKFEEEAKLLLSDARAVITGSAMAARVDWRIG